MIRLGLVLALLASACGGAKAPPAATPQTSPSAISIPTASAAPRASENPSPVPPPREPQPEPKGPAALAIHVERGRRMPLELVGNVETITPPRGESGLDAWIEVKLAGDKDAFYLLTSPPTLALPFAAGDRVRLEIDCRKGGWQRVCDGVLTDMTRRVLLIASGSGSEEVAKGWTVERGPLMTSEVRPGPVRSIRHTHALLLGSQGASVAALPHEWKRVRVHGHDYLVTGYEERWEGVRPPDAHDYRTFAIMLER